MAINPSSPFVLALLCTLPSLELPAPRRVLQSPVEGVETIAANDNRRPAGHLDQGVLTLRLEVRQGLLLPDHSHRGAGAVTQPGSSLGCAGQLSVARRLPAAARDA